MAEIMFSRTSRASIDVFIGDRLVCRLIRTKGMRRGASRPFYMSNVALMASLMDDDLGRALRKFECTALSAKSAEAEKQVADFLRGHPALIITTMFMDLPNRTVGEALDQA